MNLKIGQGHGLKGRYGGLPDPYGQESSAKIVLLPVPFDLTTTYNKGSDRGPDALIEASRNMELYDIETDSEVYLQGIYTAEPVKARTSEKMLEQLYQKTKHYLEQGKFVVAIGGEHSISYAPIRAVAEHYGKITVLQFDAHADLQPDYEGNPLSHASVIARVKELTQVDKVVSVGIRSLSKEELPFVDKENTFYGDQYDLEKVIKSLSGPIYITFDLDVFDSSLMPSTGTPEPGGLSWKQAMEILQEVFKKHNVVGFDVVELLPRECDPAPDYLAAKLIYKMLSYKFKKENKNDNS